MRKPLVVVCAAASALLLAGGVAATSAGADEVPDGMAPFGFALPGWPFSGDDPGFHASGQDGGGADLRASGQDGDEPWADERPAPPRSTVADGHHVDPGADERPDRQSDTPRSRPHDDDAGEQPRRPAGDTGDRARPQDDDRPARERPDFAPGPGAQRQPGFAQRQSTAGIMAAARQAVTAADVSSSPSAPVQQRVLALVNQNRRRGGCDPLTLDRRLIEAANEHAADMARRRYFAHESPDGDGAGDRVSEAGYRWKRYSENIARGADSPWEVVDGWMNSPTHRENILDCRLHEMGIGLAIARDRTPYWVQDFATPDA